MRDHNARDAALGPPLIQLPEKERWVGGDAAVGRVDDVPRLQARRRGRRTACDGGDEHAKLGESVLELADALRVVDRRQAQSQLRRRARDEDRNIASRVASTRESDISA